ncbi:tetratricopeptide repeat protein [Streptomyces sp. NPDC059744]|uniref:tetratricopeptide repeat protein n=1 Tax=Streptomyces sp. NPDC059744 TaxID=3346929 RepID=UPI003668C882
MALTEASRYDEALHAYARAIALFTSLDNHNERGKTLNGLGLALRESGKFSEALQAHEEALSIQRTAGDLREQAAVLNNLSLPIKSWNISKRRARLQKRQPHCSNSSTTLRTRQRHCARQPSRCRHGDGPRKHRVSATVPLKPAAEGTTPASRRRPS